MKHSSYGRMPGRRLLPFFLTGAFMLTPSLQAQTYDIHDFIGFGIQNQNIYGFTDLETRVQFTNDSLPGSSYNANHLAADPANNRLLYTKGLYDGAITELLSWDFSTDQVVVVGTLSGIGNSSGGADLWNGAYYLYADEPTGGEGITRVTFDSSGNIASLSKPYGDDNLFGGLGDIAISQDGTLYGLSDNGLYMMDLNVETPTPAYTKLSGSKVLPAGQLFFDDEGDLLTRTGDSWTKIEISGATYTVSQKGLTGEEEVYADLASSPSYVGIPEPSPLVLFSGLAAVTLFLLRRRN